MTPEPLRFPNDPRKLEHHQSLEIHWPSGTVDQVRVPAVDRIFTVEERRGFTAEFCTRCEAGRRP
jgi:hypothetical protein